MMKEVEISRGELRDEASKAKKNKIRKIVLTSCC
jgi:hypothetical protein